MLIGGFVVASRPKQTGRQVIDDIVIAPKLPTPVSPESAWTKFGPVGFTANMWALFKAKQLPSSLESTVPVTKVPSRMSEWDGQ